MRTRLVLLAVALLLVAGSVVAWVDQGVRADEDRALAGCAERAEAAAVRADQVMASMAEYIRPVIAVRPGLWSLMEGAAEEAQAPVAAALETCRGVDVLGLHRAHAREKAAYVDYLAARDAQLSAIRADGRVAGEVDPALARLRDAAFEDRP